MRRAVLIAAIAALAAGVAAPADAQKRDSGEVGDKQRDLQHTQRRLTEERAKAADAKKREAGLLSELESIDRKLGERRAQVRVLDGKIKRAQSDVADLQRDLQGLEGLRARQEEALERRLRALYKAQAAGGVLPLLFSGDDPLEKAVQLRHLATLATVDARMIREYRVTSEGLEDRKSRLETRQKELGGLRIQAETERADADQEASKRMKLLAKVKDERAYHERAVGELSEATRRLEAFIRDLQEKQRRAAAAKPPAAAKSRTATPSEAPASASGFGSLQGRLGWPVDGKVVGDFGAQVHPRFGTKTFRNGIEIDVREGTDIVAVYGGHVLYTGWFRGYGNLIIVDHGGEYYTLYGHAGEIRVKEGDEVRQGQAIGTVGDTGSLSGPRLYFEVRRGGKPQDPSQWLQPRG